MSAWKEVLFDCLLDTVKGIQVLCGHSSAVVLLLIRACVQYIRYTSSQAKNIFRSLYRNCTQAYFHHRVRHIDSLSDVQGSGPSLTKLPYTAYTYMPQRHRHTHVAFDAAVGIDF